MNIASQVLRHMSRSGEAVRELSVKEVYSASRLEAEASASVKT